MYCMRLDGSHGFKCNERWGLKVREKEVEFSRSIYSRETTAQWLCEPTHSYRKGGGLTWTQATGYITAVECITRIPGFSQSLLHEVHVVLCYDLYLFYWLQADGCSEVRGNGRGS